MHFKFKYTIGAFLTKIIFLRLIELPIGLFTILMIYSTFLFKSFSLLAIYFVLNTESTHFKNV